MLCETPLLPQNVEESNDPIFVTLKKRLFKGRYYNKQDISTRRRLLIGVAWQKLAGEMEVNVTRNGLIDLNDLKELLRRSRVDESHKKKSKTTNTKEANLVHVFLGDWSDIQPTSSFITTAQFVKYFTFLSAFIQNDNAFERIVAQMILLSPRQFLESASKFYFTSPSKMNANSSPKQHPSRSHPHSPPNQQERRKDLFSESPFPISNEAINSPYPLNNNETPRLLSPGRFQYSDLFLKDGFSSEETFGMESEFGQHNLHLNSTDFHKNKMYVVQGKHSFPSSPNPTVTANGMNYQDIDQLGTPSYDFSSFKDNVSSLSPPPHNIMRSGMDSRGSTSDSNRQSIMTMTMATRATRQPNTSPRPPSSPLQRQKPSTPGRTVRNKMYFQGQLTSDGTDEYGNNAMSIVAEGLVGLSNSLSESVSNSKNPESLSSKLQCIIKTLEMAEDIMQQEDDDEKEGRGEELLGEGEGEEGEEGGIRREVAGSISHKKGNHQGNQDNEILLKEIELLRIQIEDKDKALAATNASYNALLSLMQFQSSQSSQHQHQHQHQPQPRSKSMNPTTPTSSISSSFSSTSPFPPTSPYPYQERELEHG